MQSQTPTSLIDDGRKIPVRVDFRLLRPPAGWPSARRWPSKPRPRTGKRGGACLRLRSTLCAHRCRCFCSPATPTEPPAGVLAGLPVARCLLGTLPIFPSASQLAARWPNPPRLRHRGHGSRTTGHESRNSLATRHFPLTAAAPTSSAPRPPACPPPHPPPTRCRSRSKTPNAAHRWQRNSFRRSAPS